MTYYLSQPLFTFHKQQAFKPTLRLAKAKTLKHSDPVLFYRVYLKRGLFPDHQPDEFGSAGRSPMKQYIVDAFTDRIFGGNPAAVIVLDQWIEDDLMLSIAKENNLSETAFSVKTGSSYHLRWFTPGGEIDLCGHATLATAFVISRFIEPTVETLRFQTLSGQLTVKRDGEWLEMDFPAFELKPVEVTEAMHVAIGVMPIEAYLGRDLVLLVEDETVVKALAVDGEALKGLEGLLVHVTAKGSQYDCVTRSYASKLGIDEDPVCGSGHCHVIPYWATRLGKDHLVALQASERGGILWCGIQDGRVTLKGQAVLYSLAELCV
jgi:PhzF family phenazine biosynthesis protein